MNYKSKVSIIRTDKLSESQSNYSSKDVEVVKDMINQSFENLGGISSMLKKGDKVIIKPNLVEVPYPKTGGSVLTDPRIIEALCSILTEYGCSVLVGEGKSVNLKHVNSGAKQAFENTGLAAAARRGGADTIAWDEEEFVAVKNERLNLWESVNVPKSILDADFFINVPKLKTHGQTEITCGIKSMQGVYRTDEKIMFHDESFPWKMCDMLRVAKPDLNIVDGLICGEGFGPIYTSPVEKNIIVASTDVVATDAVCGMVMGIEPWEVPITRLAEKEGFGTANLDEIEFIGTPLNEVSTHFKRASLWNPIGYCEKIKIFAGGASRFELAQLAATVQRLEWDGNIDKIDEDVCIFIGDKPPVPRKTYKHVIICGDAAIRDCKIDGIKIPGNPPLPSVQIVQAIEKMFNLNK